MTKTNVKAVMKVQKEAKDKVFYSTVAKCSFYVDVYMDGKPVYEKDNLGNVKFRNGEPLILSKLYSFTTLNDHPEYMASYFQTDENTPKRVIEVLEKKLKDPTSSVVDFNGFQAIRNRKAVEMAKELALLEGNSELTKEVVKLQSVIEMKNNETSEKDAEIKRLNELLKAKAPKVQKG